MHGPGRDWQRKQTTSRPDTWWPDMLKHMTDASKRKAKQKWAIEKPKLDNARKLRGIHFQMLKNSRISWRMHVKSWKFRCQPQCLARFNVRSTGKLVALKRIARQNTLVLLRPTNLQESVWKDLLTNIMKIIQQEKEWIYWVTTILCTNLFLCLKQWQIPDAKAAVDKEWWKLEKVLAWQLAKVRNKNEVIAEARKEGKTVHFASLMDICHLKNSELEPEFQKYNGRVVLRGDSVKDDSGSYAVFTEQWWSASQMTAAKLMDVASRLPGCAGQAADAMSA